MSVTVYGLKNCDTCRKALKDLKAAGMEHQFVDVRADGIGEGRLANWAEKADWERLLNRRGTTWRGLDAALTTDVDELRALALMGSYPALIKRPVFELGDDVLVGYDAGVREALGLT